MKQFERLAAVAALVLPLALSSSCSGDGESWVRGTIATWLGEWVAPAEQAPGAAAAPAEDTVATPEPDVGPTADGAAAGEAGSTPAPRVYYQFVDASGSLRFVDRLAEVPVALRSGARRVEIAAARSENRSAQGHPALRDGSTPRPWAAAAAAPWERRAQRVVVYTAPWCGWCRKTLAYLDRKGVAYSNRDIEASAVYREELRRKTGSVSIPVLEVGDEIVRGYDPSAYERLLF